MRPTDAIARLAAVLRRQAGDGARRTPASATLPTSAPAGPAGPAVDDPEKGIRQRMRRIDAADPERDSKCMTVFLEAVLLREFGEPLRNDPAFHALLIDLRTELEKHDALRPGFAALIAALRT